MSDKRDPVFEEADKIKTYFEEDEEDLRKIIERLQSLQEISTRNIDLIQTAQPGRGTQHYLIEHITNAIAIQSQLQSVLNDKRKIKEKALDIAMKNMSGEESVDNNDVFAAIQYLLKNEKSKHDKATEELEDKVNSDNENTLTDEEIDKEIAKKLGN